MTLRACAAGVALAASAAVSICSAAAADLPVRPAPAPVAPVASAPAAIYNWTGFYIGGQLGAGFSNSSWSDPFTAAHNSFNSGAGFVGGAQVGGNIQFNMLVLGVEGDFAWAGLKGRGIDSIGNTINTNVSWTSTVTGRAGVAFDRVLLYGKGGVAFAQDKSGFADIFGNGANTTLTRTGWTAGAGIEYGITRNLSAKIEYDYLGFGSQPLNFTTPTTPLYTSNATLNVQEVKAGLNFRFGGP